MDAKKKSELLTRVRTVSGHIKGVEKMLENDAYCIEIIGQVQAIQAALNKLNNLILDNHLHSCVITAVQGEDVNERERVLKEIAEVFAMSSKI